MSGKYFGTDGIRGRVGEPPITADFMLRVGRAAGKVLMDERCRAVLIGKDTRISGYMFESALEAGLAASGADIHLLGPMPTPAVAHLTRSLGGCAGIVISASHNPYHDNGIKFFNRHGEKLADELEAAIEAEIDRPFEHVESRVLGKAVRIADAAGRYIEFCKGTIPYGTSLKGLKIVVDCANGATYRIAPSVFMELGAEVMVINDRPDGLNINVDCGSTEPRALADEVKRTGADLGVAFDGDGDRVIMADADGSIVNGDQILYLLATARRQAGTLAGGVVGTVMSNFGMEEAFARLGIPFERAAVGDRFVHEKLRELGWVLGGEASGHILCLDRTTTGCGIVSALHALEYVARTGKPLRELVAGMYQYPQVMINVPVNCDSGGGGAGELIHGNAKIGAALAEVEGELNGRGRVILRPSGTEPVIRVTVEGREEQQARTLARQLADAVAAGAEEAGSRF